MEPQDYGTLCRRLATEFVSQEAEGAGVVWAKIRGYPTWPAQVLPEDAAATEARLQALKRPAKEEVLPLMFFQDYTVAWVPKRDVLRWSTGMQKRLFAPHQVHEAVKEVHHLLTWGERLAPSGWWCEPPPLDPAAAAAAAAAELPPLPAKPPPAPKPQHPPKPKRPSEAAIVAGMRQRSRAGPASTASEGCSAQQSRQERGSVKEEGEEAEGLPPSVKEEAAQQQVGQQQQHQQPVGNCSDGPGEPPAVGVAGPSSMELDLEEPNEAAKPAGKPTSPSTGTKSPHGYFSKDELPAGSDLSLLGCAKCRNAPNGCVRCRKWAIRGWRPAAPHRPSLGGSSPLPAAPGSGAHDGKGKRARESGDGLSPAPAPAKRAKRSDGMAAAKQSPGGKGPKLSPWAAAAARLEAEDDDSEGAGSERPTGPSTAEAAATAAPPLLLAQQHARSGQPQLRDTLRSIVNKLKLAVPALRGTETPQNTPALAGLVDSLFGAALNAEEQRGRTWPESVAQIFSWARGSAVSVAQVEACFPTVLTGEKQVPVVKVDTHALVGLGLDPSRWEIPLDLQQVRSVAAAAACWSKEEQRWVLPWPKCEADTHCVKPQAHAGWCIKTAEGARTYLANGGPAGQPAATAAASRAGLPVANGRLVQHGKPAAGRPASNARQPKCSQSEFCPKPEGHTGFCINTAAGAAAYKKAQAAGLPATSPALHQAMLAAPQRVRSEAAAVPGGGSATRKEDPAAVALRNRKPQYVHIKQNVWVSKPRPKRLPRDDISICNCRAGPVLVAMSARQLLASTRSTPSPVEALAPVDVPAAAAAELAAAVAAVPGSSTLAAPADSSGPMDWEPAAGLAPEGTLTAPVQPPPPAAAADEDAAAVQRLVEAVFAPYQDAEAALVRQLVAAAFAAAIAADDFAAGAAAAAAAPLPCLPLPVRAAVAPRAAPAVGQLKRARSSSSSMAAASGSATGVGAATMSTRRGAPVGLPAVLATTTAGAPNEPLPRDGCGENCLNRLSFIHCDPRTCPCGDRCSNRPFALLPPPDMEVFLTPDKGWGVRATGPIQRGTFVVEYAGEVINDAECQRRAEDAKRRNEPHFYMMEMAPGLIIDARVKGNVARLLNSSCDPNCETQKWHDAANGEIRVGIFTLRDIEPGEELTYDYQFQHFGLAAAAGAYLCKCGAANCRGTMDTQPERTKDYARRIEVWWASDQAWYAGTVMGYSANTRRHTIKYDDGDVERVCLSAERYRWLDEAGKPTSAVHEPEGAAQQQHQGRKRGQAGGSGGGKKLRRTGSLGGLPAPPGPAPAPASLAAAEPEGAEPEAAAGPMDTTAEPPCLPPQQQQQQQQVAEEQPEQPAVTASPAKAQDEPLPQAEPPTGEESLPAALDAPAAQSAAAGSPLGASSAPPLVLAQPVQQEEQRPRRAAAAGRKGKTSPGARRSTAALHASAPAAQPRQQPAAAPVHPALAGFPPNVQSAIMARAAQIEAQQQMLGPAQWQLLQLQLQAQVMAQNPQFQANALLQMMMLQAQQAQQALAAAGIASEPAPPAQADPAVAGLLQQQAREAELALAAAGIPSVPVADAAAFPAAPQAEATDHGAAAAVVPAQPEPSQPDAAAEEAGDASPSQDQQQQQSGSAGPEPMPLDEEPQVVYTLLPAPNTAEPQAQQPQQQGEGESGIMEVENEDLAAAAAEGTGALSSPDAQAAASASPPAVVSTAALHGQAEPGSPTAAAAAAATAVVAAAASEELLPAGERDPTGPTEARPAAPAVDPDAVTLQQLPPAQPPSPQQQQQQQQGEPSAAEPQQQAQSADAEQTPSPPTDEEQAVAATRVTAQQPAHLTHRLQLPVADPDPQVLNPGAEAVAGGLHGNGKGSVRPLGEHNPRVLNPGAEAVAGGMHGNGKSSGRLLGEPSPQVLNPGAEAVAGGLHGNGKGGQPLGEADPKVLNPGAEAVAGVLHGNGKGDMPAGHRAGMSRGIAGGPRRGGGGAQGTARARRTVRPPSHRYGDDFEDPNDSLEPSDASEEEYASEDEEEYQVEEEEEEPPESPPRRYNTTERQRAAVAASMSPATQAAATIAALAGLEPPAAAAAAARPAAAPRRGAGAPLGGVPAQPQLAVPAGGAAGARPGRRHPTPPSTGLPARTILVAKKLTNSDVTKGRILLPRAAVEANLSFAIGRAHSLAAQDHLGRAWEFTLQSWANGMESRRVYVLEHAGEFVRSHALKPEDVIGISTTEEGSFLIEYNTDEVCNAAETQAAARPGQAGHTPAVPGGVGAEGAFAGHGHNPLISQNAGRCSRSEYCNKPAGHPGFCTRTPAGAAAASGRNRSRGSDSRPASSAARGAGPPPGAKRTHRLLQQAAQMMGHHGAGWDLEAGRPKRARKLTEKAAAMGDGLGEEEEPEAGYETPTHSGLRQGPGPAAAAAAGPGGGGAAAAGGPQDAGAVPPIFVMASSEPHPSPGGPLRSPATRVPSSGMLTSQGSGLPVPPVGVLGQGLAAAAAGGGMPLGLRGMGKLLPSPVQPPMLSPLPALNGPAPIPPNTFAHLQPHPAQPRPMHPHGQPAVDVAEFLAGSNPEEEQGGQQQQQQQHGPGSSLVRPGGAAAGAQPGAGAALGLSLPAPVAPPTLAAPGLAAYAQQQAAAAAAAYGMAGALPPAYLPALPVAPLNVPGVPGAGAAAGPDAAAAAAAAAAAEQMQYAQQGDEQYAAAEYAIGGEYVLGADGQYYVQGPDSEWYVIAPDGQWYQAEGYYQEHYAAEEDQDNSQEDYQQGGGYAPGDQQVDQPVYGGAAAAAAPEEQAAAVAHYAAAAAAAQQAAMAQYAASAAAAATAAAAAAAPVQQQQQQQVAAAQYAAAMAAAAAPAAQPGAVYAPPAAVAQPVAAPEAYAQPPPPVPAAAPEAVQPQMQPAALAQPAAAATPPPAAADTDASQPQELPGGWLASGAPAAGAAPAQVAATPTAQAQGPPATSGEHPSSGKRRDGTGEADGDKGPSPPRQPDFDVLDWLGDSS